MIQELDKKRQVRTAETSPSLTATMHSAGRSESPSPLYVLNMHVAALPLTTVISSCKTPKTSIADRTDAYSRLPKAATFAIFFRRGSLTQDLFNILAPLTSGGVHVRVVRAQYRVHVHSHRCICDVLASTRKYWSSTPDTRIPEGRSIPHSGQRSAS